MKAEVTRISPLHAGQIAPRPAQVGSHKADYANRAATNKKPQRRRGFCDQQSVTTNARPALNLNERPSHPQAW